MFVLALLTFFSKLNFSKPYHSVRWFGTRSGSTFCWSSSGSKLFVADDKKLLIARKKLNQPPTKHTYFLLHLSSYEKVLVTGLMRTINNFHLNDSRTCKNRKYWHQLFSIILVICWWCTMATMVYPSKIFELYLRYSRLFWCFF